jgi:hypothetical protein
MGWPQDHEDFIFHEDFSAYSTGILREAKSLRDHEPF